MAALKTTRKTRFRRALEDEGTSISEWARRNEVSRTHLYAVLDDQRDASIELHAKIEAVLARKTA